MEKSDSHRSFLKEKDGVPQPGRLNREILNRFRTRRKKEPAAEELFQGIINKDQVALSRAITLIESTAARHQEAAREIITRCLPHSGNSIRIGITGIPGVGKSTFIESFGKLLIDRGKRVAALTVDPSSSISKGSILGDKTRMEKLVKEDNAFIRPSPSGDTLGGVARKTRETIILCEAAGFDVILIETVGVGQSETAVHSMTDFFLLLKLAGAGDELQGMKRGIMEMADTIVINKADGDNLRAAKIARNEFNRALHLFPAKKSGWTPKAMLCSALKNEGIDRLWEEIENYFKTVQSGSYFLSKRKEQDSYWLMQTIETGLKDRFFARPEVKNELQKQLNALEKNTITPFEAAEIILKLQQ